MLEVIGGREQGYAQQVQRLGYTVGDRIGALGDAGGGVVVPEAVERSAVVDETLEYLASLMFNTLRSLVESNQLNTLKDDKLGECHEVTNCQFERAKLPVMFQKVPLRVMEVVVVTHQECRLFRWLRLKKAGSL